MKRNSLMKKMSMGLFSLIAGVMFTVSGVDAADAGVAIDANNFPDDSFRGYLEVNVDTDSNKILSTSEISNVTTMNIRARGISDLTGIANFVNLRSLNCSSNSLTSVSLKANNQLTYLNVSNNDLKSLDVSTNKEIETLMCGGNKLMELKLENNTSLTTLDIAGNDITSIDLAKLTDLSVLNVSDNALTSLNVNNNTLLNSITAYGNQLTSVNFSNNKNLTNVNVNDNQLVVLDLKANEKLLYVACEFNNIMSFSLPVSVETVNCSNNDLYYADIADLVNLKNLNISNNHLYKLDVSANAKLEKLDASFNNLAALDTTANTLLTEGTVNVSGNQREIYVDTTYQAEMTGTGISLAKVSGLKSATISDAVSGGALVIGNEKEMPEKVTYSYDIGNGNKGEFTLIPIKSKKLVPDTKTIAIYLSDKEYTIEYPLSVVAIGGEAEITWASGNSSVAMVTNEGKLVAIGAGTTTITASATGFDSAVFTVNVYKEVTGVEIEDIPSQYYTGKEVKPTPVVKLDKTVLVEGTDYNVVYENNINAGTAIVTVKGIGKYRFSVSKKFKICYNISSMTADVIADQIFTGKEIKPGVVIKNGTTVLIEGTDYTLSYANNVALGTGIVTVTGIGNYAGTRIQSFNIIVSQVTELVKTDKKPKQITLTWKAIDGVTGYRIYKYNPTTKKYAYLKQLNGATSNTYTDTSLTAGTKYRYRVRAFVTVNGVKNYGKYSSKLITCTRPAKAKIKVKASKGGKATITWGKLEGTGYRIYMKTGNGKFSKIKEVTKKSTVKYTKTGLKKGTTYYFKVRAYKTVNGVKTYGAYSKIKTIIAK